VREAGFFFFFFFKFLFCYFFYTNKGILYCIVLAGRCYGSVLGAYSGHPSFTRVIIVLSQGQRSSDEELIALTNTTVIRHGSLGRL
jgi:hypothetical protein